MAKSTPDSIYCKLLKLTRAKEDFFTEALAYALKNDIALFRNFLEHILGSEISGLEEANLAIQTQVPFPFGRLDMVVTINNTIKIVIENKLWSQEGDGQLRKYISNGEVNYLAFITAENGYKIDPKVLNDEKYLKPTHAHHFTWGGVFPIVNDLAYNSHVGYYLSELHHLFIYLGFGKTVQPTTGQQNIPVKVEYLQPTEEIRTYNRKSAENMFTLQTSVQEMFQKIIKENSKAIDNLLTRYNWGSCGKKIKLIGNKHGQIYAYNMNLADSSLLLRLYVTPTIEGNAVRIRFTINNKTEFKAFVGELESKLNQSELLYELLPDLRKQEQVEIVIPLTGVTDDSPRLGYLLSIFETVLKSAERAVNQIDAASGDGAINL